MEWIKCSDGMPNLKENVLVVNSDGFRVAYLTDYMGADDLRWSNESDSCGCCDSFDDNITYWARVVMPEEC